MPTSPHEGYALMPPTTGSTHFFGSASAVNINGGTYIGTQITTVSNDTTNTHLERLYKLVAPNAILNRGGRADAVRCYPGTREEVLARVEAWRSGGYRTDRHLFWLSGPAGAGKSAIVQTVAETCNQRGIPMINFFLFRSDPTRNHARPLVPTWIVQLLKLDPNLRPYISSIIRDDPVILEASLEEQFKSLIIRPIINIWSTSPSKEPILVLLDGLDECDSKPDQVSILQILHDTVNLPNSPFIALISSRSESQIVMAFNSLATFRDSIFLDDTYRPSRDIYRYTSETLSKLAKTHPLRHMLGSDKFPLKSDIAAITDKSSGQFIYAATVVRFVSNPSVSPWISVQTVLGIRPTGKRTPFAEIDALYTHILSQVEEWDVVRDVIDLRRISHDKSHRRMEMIEALKYSIHDIYSSFIDLAPIMRLSSNLCDTSYLHFYHTSLNDFLYDQTRSGSFYIGLSAVATKMLHKVLAGCNRADGTLSQDNLHILSLVRMLLSSIETATVDLSSALQQIALAKVSSRMYHDDAEINASSILTRIETLYRDFDKDMGSTIIRCWFDWFQKASISTRMP